MQEARKAMGVKQKHLAINRAIQRKSQYEGEQKYSTTNENINFRRTMIIRKYFPVSRDIQGNPHKIKHMARDKK